MTINLFKLGLTILIMDERRFVYSIEGLSPQTRNGEIEMGGFGFSIYLDTEFAKKAYKTLLPEGHHLNEIAEKILVDCKLIRENGVLHNPYRFAENRDGKLTTLLRWVQVPGCACDLGIEGNEFGKIIEGEWINSEIQGFLGYYPHNVDSYYQAYGLLSLFTTWANLTNNFLD